MQFKDVKIGQHFDFINEAKPNLTSFWCRCRKSSARQYVWTQSGKRFCAQVGTTSVEVFHVSDDYAY